MSLFTTAHINTLTLILNYKKKGGKERKEKKKSGKIYKYFQLFEDIFPFLVLS